MTRLPADRGLSGLALVMQLGGGISAAFMAAAALVYWIGFKPHDVEFGTKLLLLATAIARSVVHAQAGNDLVARGLGPLKRYVIVGLAQTLIAVILLVRLRAPGDLIAVLAVGLAAWPAILGAMIVRRHFEGATAAEDRGCEGASILMTILGIAGTFASLVVLAVLVQLRSNLHRGASGLFFVIAALLLARSVLHVHAGIAGLRGDPRTHELAQRYASFGVITSFCAAGALFLMSLIEGFDFIAMLITVLLAILLVIWPLVVRRFFTDRLLADIADDTHATRVPDAGLTALGWLLVGHATIVAVIALPQISGGMSLAKLDDVFATPKPWLHATVGALELVAGLALVHMVALHRVIATAAGAIATIATVYLYWPLLRELGRDDDIVLALPIMALQLALPIACIFLVRREVAPTARARYRPRQPPDTITS